MAGLGKEAAKQVADMLRREKGRIRNTRQHRGRWNAGGGSGGMQAVHFKITSVLRGFGLDCNAVMATVINVGCNSSGVTIGDTIEVWDGLRCKLSLPEDLLIDLEGYAIQMMNPGVNEANVGPGPVAEGACRWEVIDLCCAEEV